MVGICSQELLAINSHQSYLQKNIQTLIPDTQQWLKDYAVVCPKTGQNCLDDNYFLTLISGEYDEHFYMSHYRQAIKWRLAGLNQGQAILLMNHIRKQLITLAEGVTSHELAKGLCHALDLSQSIVSTVYQIADEVSRQKYHTENEIKRINRSFSVIGMQPPKEVLQPYLNHQDWKFLAYAIALGENPDHQSLELSETKCRLAQWLQNGGEHLIPKNKQAEFHAAHRQIHQLGAKAIQFAQSRTPEHAIELINTMEKASDVVSEILLNVIEDEFVRLATNDALTNMPNKRAFDLQFSKSLALAERNKLWMGLVLLDVDHFKAINDTYGHVVGDQVLKEVANIIHQCTRLEESAFRWGGEEFAVITLDKHADASSLLAQRIRQTLEAYEFTIENHNLKLTISGGSICFKAPISQPSHEIFSRVDKQLYQAKEQGRNQICHQIVEDI